MERVGEYLNSWREFEDRCEKKAKGRCYINSKGWRKLREFHMEDFLKDHPAPFGFMFVLKHRYPGVYRRIWCGPKFYHLTKLKRRDKFEDSIGRKVVSFPSWKGFFERDDEEV